MPEVFRCPSCSAPLEFEGKTIQKCDFCESNVVFPSEMFGRSNADILDNASSLSERVIKLAEINREIKAGRKINAIKIFRETFGIGLKESKDAVEALERGECIDISQINIRNADLRSRMMNSEAKRRIVQLAGNAGIGKALLVVFIISAATIATMYFVSKALIERYAKLSSSESRTVSIAQTWQTVQTQTALGAKRSIAQEILKFGAEGTSPGKFKDNRTIAVDANSKIYSADYWGGRIQIFDKDGVF